MVSIAGITGFDLDNFIFNTVNRLIKKRFLIQQKILFPLRIFLNTLFSRLVYFGDKDGNMN